MILLSFAGLSGRGLPVISFPTGWTQSHELQIAAENFIAARIVKTHLLSPQTVKMNVVDFSAPNASDVMVLFTVCIVPCRPFTGLDFADQSAPVENVQIAINRRKADSRHGPPYFQVDFLSRRMTPHVPQLLEGLSTLAGHAVTGTDIDLFVGFHIDNRY